MWMRWQQTGYCQLNRSCQDIGNAEMWWAWILSRSYGSCSAVILTESLHVYVIFLQHLIWILNDGDSALACCCQVKLGSSKWVSGWWWTSDTRVMALLSFPSTQVTLKRPASSPAPPTASSANGPTGPAAVSPVGAAWRFDLNGCAKSRIMEEGLAPNWTMSTRYLLPLGKLKDCDLDW